MAKKPPLNDPQYAHFQRPKPQVPLTYTGVAPSPDIAKTPPTKFYDGFDGFKFNGAPTKPKWEWW